MSIAFLVTTFVVVATPGTGALLTITAGLRSGPRRSLITAAGCTLGIVPHLAAAVSGTAALLRAGGLAFEIVRILGVAYLLYMAWSTWRHAGVRTESADQAPVPAARVIVSAVLANLLNPKLTIFFFAFLPQFVGPQATSPIPQMIGLSAVFMAMTFVVFGIYGVGAGLARGYLARRPAVIRRLQRTFSVAFVGLAGTLVATR